MSQYHQKRTATNGNNFTPTIHHDTYPTISPAPTSCSGLHVFITGASKGIGRATAIAYARAGAAAISLGARSDLADVEKEVLQAAAEAGTKEVPRVRRVKLDVRSRESVEAAARETERWCEDGGLDVLVNNAGVLEKWMPIAESDPEEWWGTWDLTSSTLTFSPILQQNVRGTYLMTRSFLPLLLKGSGKTILNISSGGAHSVVPGASAYQMTKLAILRFSEFINAEYQEQGIVAFSLHPGGVATDVARCMPQAMQDLWLKDSPELAAHTIVYLTQKRQEWLRGRYINVQWDMDEFFAKKEEVVEKDLLRVRLAVE
ncbi:MAG: hypothetical protein Q9208_001725 [Pyrenodesmia sp. 3 TL-2023]